MNTMTDTPLRKSMKSKAQDFQALKQECLDNGTLFEDPEFPCTEESLKLKTTVEVEWVRPKDIPNIDEPRFILEEFSRFDIDQGKLGDCWFLSTLASMTLHPELVRSIVPSDQSFKEGDYAGIFHFKFWKNGKWVDIVVDDRLPILTGKQALLFEHSSKNNEFWAALIEKAYAKFYGNYGALISGWPSEAMVDITGGVVEKHYISSTMSSDEVYTILGDAFQKDRIVACVIQEDYDSLRDLGLVGNHAYSILGVKTVDGNKLVNLRNPWGGRLIWKGTWATGVVEFDVLDQAKELDDGEFWMLVSDFCVHFDYVDVCFYTVGDSKIWTEKILDGTWVKGLNAGGPRNLETYHLNPQYPFVLRSNDTSEDGEVILSLLQVNRRRERLKNLPLGFEVYQLKEGEDNSDLRILTNLNTTSQYLRRREETCRVKLQHGKYIVVPSMSKPDQEAHFIIRFICKKKMDLRILTPTNTGVSYMLKEFLREAGKHHEIDSNQLRLVLKHSLNKTLSLTADDYDALLAKYDDDESHDLTYKEFEWLWEDVTVWLEIFNSHDYGKGKVAVTIIQEDLQKRGFHHLTDDYLSARGIQKDGLLTFEESLLLALDVPTKTPK